jgi:membrane-bound metal-dependent hydrolase YbcI (DUF457 family)
MPVIGHAFVGIATADAARTWRRNDGATSRYTALWVPSFVLLAYLPDLPGVMAPVHWVTTGRLLGHSLLFAGVVAPLMALVLSGLGLSFRPALGWTLLSVLLHDALDFMQASDREPFWPFSDRIMGLGWDFVPRGTWVEAAIFAGASALVGLALRFWHGPMVAAGRPPRRRVIAAWGLTLAMVTAAYLTQVARDSRQRDYSRAEDALQLKEYARCLQLLDAAERWPATQAPGRVDYLRGEAFAGLGQSARAEEAYLRSYRAEPGYFWLVADLAAFYAATDRPVEERRRLVDPLVARLVGEFRDEPGLPEALARIDRRLHATPAPEKLR